MEVLIRSEGANLWSVSTGTGSIPVLLLNGGPGCDDYLAPVAELLEQKAKVIRFEPRGTGRSGWDGRYDLATAVSDIDTVRRYYNLEQVLLIGHSFGPCLGLAYCLAYPDQVTGLIGLAGGKVVDDRSWSDTYHQNQEERGEDMGGQIFNADPALNRALNESWKAFCRQPDFLRRLADLNVPMLFINGGRDIRPNWPTEQLASLLPNAGYEVIPEAAHFLWLSHKAELQVRLIGAIDTILENPQVRAP